MAPKILVAACAALLQLSPNEAATLRTSAEALSSLSLEHLRHSAALANGTRHMTMERALQVLQSHPGAPREILSLVHTKWGQNRTQVSGLRSSGSRRDAPAGETTYHEDLASARDKLNDMIYEVQMQYEIEHKKCCDYEHTKKALIEDAAQDIALFNAESAAARATILDAQSIISICENRIPRLRDALAEHNRKCDASETALRNELSVVSGDKEVMESLSDSAKCPDDGAATMLLQCNHPCTQETHMLFSDHRIRRVLSKLRSKTARDLLQHSLKQVHFAPHHGHHVSALIQEEVEKDLIEDYNSRRAREHRLHHTARRLRSGAAEHHGASPGPCTKPPPTDTRSTKCAIGPGDCKVVQERLLEIQSKIIDKQRDIEDEIKKLNDDCKEVKTSLESQINDFSTQLLSEQSRLAAATKEQNTADEQNRLKSAEKTDLEKEFLEMTETCHKNYQSFEDQECGLKKIRGELTKLKTPGASGAYEDCQLTEWSMGECSKTCEGGEQTLTRTVISTPRGGVKCLPLARVQPCNEQKCPIDCKVADWQSWSGCTAECGGGIMQRGRLQNVKAKYGGRPCGETSEVRSCNQQSCNSDCTLGEWTKWSLCSKGCGGGRQRRLRFIDTPARGTGSCPKQDSEDRLQYLTCNTKACPADLVCESKLDVVLLLDGSSRLGEAGWEAMKQAGQKLVSKLGAGGEGQVQVSTILFSGPQTLKGLSTCTNEDPSAAPPDLEKDCKIKVVSQLTADTAGVADKIKDLAWPAGSALTSVALGVAEAELALGRKDANSVVVVITRGKPLSNDMTTLMAKRLKKKARVMWVPVTGFEGLEVFSWWSSDPDDENVLAVKDFSALKEQVVVDNIISSLCPDIRVEKVETPADVDVDR